MAQVSNVRWGLSRMSVSHRIGTRRVDENVSMFPSLHESVVITRHLFMFSSSRQFYYFFPI